MNGRLTHEPVVPAWAVVNRAVAEAHMRGEADRVNDLLRLKMEMLRQFHGLRAADAVSQ